MAFASPLRISYVHFATRELQRCFIVKLCPPLRKMVSTSRAKMYQAPPPLSLSIVWVKGHMNYCAEGGRSLGTRLGRALCLEYRVSWVRVPPEAAHFSRKSDCLGCAVLLCLVCLTLLASFFLPSHFSFKNMYIIPITEIIILTGCH